LLTIFHVRGSGEDQEADWHRPQRSSKGWKQRRHPKVLRHSVALNEHDKCYDKHRHAAGDVEKALHAMTNRKKIKARKKFELLNWNQMCETTRRFGDVSGRKTKLTFLIFHCLFALLK
jgi:hypothetical protein